MTVNIPSTVVEKKKLLRSLVILVSLSLVFSLIFISENSAGQRHLRVVSASEVIINSDIISNVDFKSVTGVTYALASVNGSEGELPGEQASGRSQHRKAQPSHRVTPVRLQPTEPTSFSTRDQRPSPADLSGPMNCSLLERGDRDERRRVQAWLEYEQQYQPTEEFFIGLTGNCSAFRQRMGYWDSEPSSTEKDFPLAFGIRMHKNVAQAEKLLRAIYMEHNVYCIHVDARSPRIVHQAMAAIAKCLPNVYMSSKSFNYVYGGFSPVEVDLHVMKQLRQTDVPWKYFLNVAGTEFPLKTNLEMVHILQYLNGSNDIEQFVFPKNLRYRFEFKYVTLKMSRQHVPTGKPKEKFQDGNVTLMKGCSYNAFTRGFVEWVLTDRFAQDFIEWSKGASSPDEMVWATLNHLPGTPGGYPVQSAQSQKNFLSREVIWHWSGAYCYGEYVHEICILSHWELPWLSRRWELFANKFDLNKNPVVLDCLEQKLTHRRKHPDPENAINWERIKKVPHVMYARGSGNYTPYL